MDKIYNVAFVLKYLETSGLNQYVDDDDDDDNDKGEIDSVIPSLMFFSLPPNSNQTYLCRAFDWAQV